MPETKVPTKNLSRTQPKATPNLKLTNFKQRFVTLSAQKKTKPKNLKLLLSIRKNKSPIITTKLHTICHFEPVPNSTNLAPSPISSLSSHVDELVLVAQAQAALVGFDEINKLIKKLTLSFSAQKNESTFFIKTGIFEGARFLVTCEEKDLHLKINNIAQSAHRLLCEHQEYLHLRLNRKEINLKSIMFNS